MKSFEDLIEEARSFGLSSHLDVTELRIMYYGRLDMYVAFTDDGELSFSPDDGELDRPDGLIAYDVRDVVGKKVRSGMFYANVVRLSPNAGKQVKDVKHYSSDDLRRDIGEIRKIDTIEPEMVDMIIESIMSDSSMTSPFAIFWRITEYLAKLVSLPAYSSVWASILSDLGYASFSDPSRTGMINGRKVPVTLYIQQDDIEPVDILPIQGERSDPRKRIRDKVERDRRLMRNARNRIAKKIPLIRRSL